jgi:hypothetical protein
MNDLVKIVLKNRDALLYRAGFAQGRAQAAADLGNLEHEHWHAYAQMAQADAAKLMTQIQRPSFWQRIRGAMIGWRHGWSSGVPGKGSKCAPSLTPQIK